MPVFLPVPFLADRGHPGAMTVASLRQSLDALPDPGRRIAAAEAFTPRIGYAAEISGLLDLLHTRGLPVLVRSPWHPFGLSLPLGASGISGARRCGSRGAFPA